MNKPKRVPSKLSARNQLRGRISSINKDAIVAQIEIDVEVPAKIVSIITSSSAQELNLKAGDEVYAIIKSTEVMIGKD